MSTGYKAFEKGMICKDKQYKENTTYEENGNKICKAGVMHFCENPFDVLNYYPLVNENGDIPDFADVEAIGDIYKKEDKSATNKLHIGAKLGLKGFVKACVDFTIEKTKVESIKDNDNNNKDYARIGSSGDYARIGSSGDYARIGSSGYSTQISSSGYSTQIGSSGYYVQIGSSGNSTKISSSGYYAQICSSGDYARIGSSGNSTKISSSGNSAQIGSSGGYTQISSSGNSARINSSGDSTQISSSGNSTQISSSGNYAQIGSSGGYTQIVSEGKNSVVMAAGYNSTAKAKIGSWITLTEWKQIYDKDKDNLYWIPKCVKAEYVDGERIKEDVFYKLENGEFVEVVKAE